jgi:hypothetical protein
MMETLRIEESAALLIFTGLTINHRESQQRPNSSPGAATPEQKPEWAQAENYATMPFDVSQGASTTNHKLLLPNKRSSTNHHISQDAPFLDAVRTASHDQ